jgi:hypothetical protein
MKSFLFQLTIKKLPRNAAASKLGKASQATQVIDQSQQHDPNDKADTNLHSPSLDSFRQGAPPGPLDEIEKQMAAIEHRNRQQIEHPQAYAQIGEKIQKVSHP